MDWSKAKTILIGILIVVNIVLATIIYREEDTVKSENDSIEHAKSYLESVDIGINADIPNKVETLSAINVQFEVIDINEMNKNFFDGNGIKDLRRNIEYKDETINIINDRRLLYEKEFDSGKPVTISSEEAVQKASEFLAEKRFVVDDMLLSSIKKEEYGYELVYSKVYENIKVERSFTNITVNDDGVVKLDRLWINVLDDTNSPIDIGSASKALFSLIDKKKYYGNTIEEIEVCYYFDPEEQGYVEDITKTERGRAIPAWRISFEDGSRVVIDNY
ncbi:MAG: hypothetical protein GXZ08_05275 [Tissierellia bacterium]|nr:hypothetical protein [Tissierellia bacterium]